MLAALAFVPEADVEIAFEALADELPLEAQPVVDYFEDTYIGRVRQQVRRGATYPISVWNVNSRVQSDLPCTNNAVEGWHRSFQSHLAGFHPNIWKFIQILQRQQALTEVSVEQFVAGDAAAAKRLKYRDLDTRIGT